jgi:hypothetical protein
MKNRQTDEEGDNIEHTHDLSDSSRPIFKTTSGSINAIQYEAIITS